MIVREALIALIYVYVKSILCSASAKRKWYHPNMQYNAGAISH
jgi:hypothetical protein